MATAGKDLSSYELVPLPQVHTIKIGLVVSRWNGDITANLADGAKEVLRAHGLAEESIFEWAVPGSFELIYGCRRMIQNLQPDAVIAIGSVIRGETSHFHYVCEAVSQGIKDLNILTETPVIFCVLTDDHKQQALDRSGGIHGNKGVEAAVAALHMAVLKGNSL